MSDEDKPWFTYIVRCCDGSLYTGITNRLELRIAKHNKGTGAKYTRSRIPVSLVWSKQQPNWLTAAREEIRIKKLSREQKELLIKSEL